MDIIISGDPEYRGTCITATECRHDPSHCWGRAVVHIMRFPEFNFFDRMDAAAICAKVADIIVANTPPPKGPRFGVVWGWGKGWPGT